MTSNDQFNNILNECLDRVLLGESIEQCLRTYPEQSKELEPLLRTARLAKMAATVQPRTEFKARARREFQSALQDIRNKKSRRTSLFSWHWQWQSGWAIALIVILVLVLSGGGTVVASSNSMPDNTLYPVKLAAEKVKMAFTFSEIDKAELNAGFADNRVQEIIYLASNGNLQNVQVAAQRLNGNLAAMNNLVGDVGNVKRPELTPGAMESTISSFSQTGGAQTSKDAAGNVPPSLGQSIEVASSAVAAVSAPPLPVVPAPAPQAMAPMVTAEATAAAQSTGGKSGSGDLNASPETMSYPTLPGEGTSVNSINPKNVELEKLKQTIIYKATTNKALLEQTLDIASPEVRPALRQALAQAMVEYDKAIKIIERSINSSR
jgi:hypothetical protein